MYSKVMKWVNTGAFAAMIIVNALANLIPFGGKTTGQVSEAYSNLFTPAPITFAIWGLIYLVMGIFVIEQWGVGAFRENGPKYLDAIGPWFAVSCIFNIGWIFSWHADAIGLSCIMILGMLVSLIFAEVGISSVSATGLSRVITVGGFDLYLGWIVAALIANTCVYLSQFSGSGLLYNDLYRTITALVVGTLIAVMIELLFGKWVTVASVLWAFVGIMNRHISPSGHAGAYPAVIIAVMIGAFVILLSIIFRSFGGKCVPAKKNAAQTDA